MNGLWLQDGVLSFRRDLPWPRPQPDQALVRLRLAGICSTDLELLRGYYPFEGILGHEFVGEVIESPGDSSWVGRRVVGEINIVCGSCRACRAGRSTHCEQRKTLGIRGWNGAFAEGLILPLRNLHRVPETLPDEAAVFTEPLAAALEILEQVTVRPSDQVLVIGAGRLGQLVAQVLALTGCRLQVVIRHPHQQQILARRNIAAIAPQEVSAGQADIVVEATGNAAGFDLARQAVRPRGVIVLKSTYHGTVQANFSSLVVDEITLVGSRCGPFEPALRLLASRQVDPLPLISDRLPLSQGLQAFSQAAQPGRMKVLLEP